MKKFNCPMTDTIQGIVSHEGKLYLTTMRHLFYADEEGLWREVGTEALAAGMLVEWDGCVMWRSQKESLDSWKEAQKVLTEKLAAALGG